MTHLSAINADAIVRWALAADPHFSADPEQQYNGSVPDTNLREAIASILQSQVQAALINGDLAWDAGLPQDYARLHATLDPLAARIPTCLMLGNHDHRPAFLAEFAQNADAVAEKVVTVVEHGPIRFILLDSLFRTDIVGGLLGNTQRLGLQHLLETTDDRPTLLVVHHPIGETDDKLLDSDRLLRIVEPFTKVKAIVTAHDHAYQVTSCGRIAIICLPALGMPFEASEPIGWVEATLSATQCVLKFHALAENRERDERVSTLCWE